MMYVVFVRFRLVDKQCQILNTQSQIGTQSLKYFKKLLGVRCVVYNFLHET